MHAQAVPMSWPSVLRSTMWDKHRVQSTFVSLFERTFMAFIEECNDPSSH